MKTRPSVHIAGGRRVPLPPPGKPAHVRQGLCGAKLSTRRSRIVRLPIRVAPHTAGLSLRAVGTICRAGRRTPPAHAGAKPLVTERPHLAVAVFVGFEMQMPAVPGLLCVQSTVPHIAQMFT